jgi:hypothetical protein
VLLVPICDIMYCFRQHRVMHAMGTSSSNGVQVDSCGLGDTIAGKFKHLTAADFVKSRAVLAAGDNGSQYSRQRHVHFDDWKRNSTDKTSLHYRLSCDMFNHCVSIVRALGQLCKRSKNKRSL